jgi:hypothetical protein
LCSKFETPVRGHLPFTNHDEVFRVHVMVIFLRSSYYVTRASALGKYLVPRDNIPRIPDTECGN